MARPPTREVIEMRKIEAIIRPERLEAVREALDSEGFHGMTVTEVEGRGRQKGVTLQWRAGEYTVELLPKVKLELVVQDEEVDDVIDTVHSEAETGKVGDGKIFVSPVEEAVRVRTGERGGAAL